MVRAYSPPKHGHQGIPPQSAIAPPTNSKIVYFQSGVPAHAHLPPRPAPRHPASHLRGPSGGRPSTTPKAATASTRTCACSQNPTPSPPASPKPCSSAPTSPAKKLAWTNTPPGCAPSSPKSRWNISQPATSSICRQIRVETDARSPSTGPKRVPRCCSLPSSISLCQYR